MWLLCALLALMLAGCAVGKPAQTGEAGPGRAGGVVMDMEPYMIAMQPIPDRLEKAIAKGVVPGEFPSWSEAGTVFENWERYADRVTRAKDGRVLVTCATDMPGVTPQMIDWWFGWHVSDTQRYKLWHPTAHTWTRAKENRDHFENDRAKYIGNVSYVNEYIGGSHKRLAIAFHKPEAFGISDIYEKSGTAICARTSDRFLKSEGGALVHLIIPTDDGCRMYSSFWLGEIVPHWPVIRWLLKPVLNTATIRKMIISDKMAIDLLRHCAEEMNHMPRFLPQLYGDVQKAGSVSPHIS